MITIALIDKFPILRKGLSLHIHETFEGVVVLVSESIQAFYDEYPGQHADMIILGINQFPSIGVTEDIEIVKKRYPMGRIIIYDEKPDHEMMLNYLKANISGYISKQNSIYELDVCIQAVLQGKRYICLEVLDAVSYESLIKKDPTPEDNLPE